MRALSLSLLLCASVLEGAEATRLVASTASTLMLEGSSNVTGWRCRGASIDAEMVIGTTADHINQVIDRIEDGNIGVWMANPSRGRFPTPSFDLNIPVKEFRCGNRVMESDMSRALKADRHPNVEFSFRELRGGVRHDLDTGLYHATVVGDLTLAGVTRRIEVTVSAQRLSRSAFRIRAVLPLRMTDFEVTPPSAPFGAIRARDNLTVRFDLTLRIAEAPRRQS
jgi:hypothetical protein